MFRRNLLKKGLIVTTLTLSLFSGSIPNKTNIVYAATTTNVSTGEEILSSKGFASEGYLPTDSTTAKTWWFLTADGELIIMGNNDIDVTNYTWKVSESDGRPGIWETAGIDKTKVKKVYIDSSNRVSVNNCEYMFADFPNLSAVYLNGINTSLCFKFNYMFANCPKLADVDLSGVKIDHVYGHSGMFDTNNVIAHYISPVGYAVVPTASISKANGAGNEWLLADGSGSVYASDPLDETVTEPVELCPASRYNAVLKTDEFSITSKFYNATLYEHSWYVTSELLREETFKEEEGYEWKWYWDQAYTVSLESKPILRGNLEDVTLYGKKVLKQRRVSYVDSYDYLNGGNPEYITIADGEVALKPLERAGYTFLGWYTDRTYETKVTSISYGATTVYAKWEKITTEAPTTAVPTTEKVTEAPTTVAPTTAAPTTEKVTEAPTTAVPTTEKVTEEPNTEALTTEVPNQNSESSKNITLNGITYEYSKNTDGYIVVNCDSTVQILVIPDFITVNNNIFPITGINKEAFRDNKTITSVSIGKNCISVGENAFYGCENLVVADFSKCKNLQNIDSTCFTGCNKLTSLKFATISNTTQEENNSNSDTTSPILGFKNKLITKKSVVVSAKDSNLSYITVNGGVVKNGSKFTNSGTYKVIAVDKAGNSSSASFTIDKKKPTIKVSKKKVIIKDTNGLKYIQVGTKKYTSKTAKKKVTINLKKKGIYKIKACDCAGNIKSLKVTIKK